MFALPCGALIADEDINIREYGGEGDTANHVRMTFRYAAQYTNTQETAGGAHTLFA